MGSRGFSDTINTAIVVKCSLKHYFMGEIHQAYVDGGLYAMSLMYALHSLGVGTIPLTLGMTSNKLKSLHNTFHEGKDELPILIIGVGALKDTFKVAISNRKDISEYVKIIS
jgi:nitroreductase